MSRLLSILAVCVFPAFAPGCAAVVAGAAGVGAVKYAGNASQRSYSADGESTWAATLSAMRDVGYPVDPAASYTTTGGAVSISDAKVRVRAAENGRSHVVVRIGTFDNRKNRERARRILDGIEAYLAPPAP